MGRFQSVSVVSFVHFPSVSPICAFIRSDAFIFSSCLSIGNEVNVPLFSRFGHPAVTLCTYSCLQANHNTHASINGLHPLPGDFFIPTFRCPHRFERIGAIGDGGKWVCGLERVAKQSKCVIYSFGLSPMFCCRPSFVTARVI